MSTDNKPFCIIFSRKPISECFKKTWQVTICSRCEFEKSNKHSGNKYIITYGRFSNFSSTKYRFIMTFLETVCCWSYWAVVIDITILMESHLCFGIINLFFKSIEKQSLIGIVTKWLFYYGVTLKQLHVLTWSTASV